MLENIACFLVDYNMLCYNFFTHPHRVWGRELMNALLLRNKRCYVIEKERTFMAETKEIVLSVPDVSCEHCVKTINGSLGALHGVESVNTDISSKTVQLRYDPSSVSLAQIEETLDDVGYTVAK